TPVAPARVAPPGATTEKAPTQAISTAARALPREEKTVRASESTPGIVLATEKEEKPAAVGESLKRAAAPRAIKRGARKKHSARSSAEPQGETPAAAPHPLDLDAPLPPP